MSIGSIAATVKQSFIKSIGDIVFGMEDGTVSIFGLVFGVAASASSSKVVVLAGATGAIAAAVSMMAGAYLDATTAKQKALAEIAHERQEIKKTPEQEDQEIRHRLERAGFSQQETSNIVNALQHKPHAQLQFEEAFELHLSGASQENPVAHAIWMFIADLFAAFTPVTPFFFFALAPARIVSITVTAILLVILGVGRALVGHKPIVTVTLETLCIAAAAAGAGVLIGKLITS